MKIHAFKVNKEDKTADLVDVLKLINAEKRLDKRIRLINRAELRVDSIELRDGVWLLDFVKFRQTQGPGRGKKKAKTEGFDFKRGESFAEETAALYDPATNYILIQYNHSGVRAGSIAQYLSDYDGTSANIYSLDPKYDPDTERKLQQKAIKKSLSFRIDVTQMSAQDLKNGVALEKAIGFGRDCSAGQITVELSAGGARDNGLKGKVNATLKALRSLAGDNPAAVQSVKIGGKASEDDAVEVLDLLTERLHVELTDIKPGPDLRLPLDDRWKGILRARNSWKKVLT